ncbi:MAG TPA: pilus assembly protein N-terminal domain-containing protein [Gammaproteobacteria bacterium]|nr:pilus assembly protein N-terminal domain-containing protein [Gammaproteobacteria bacterium]
MRRLALIALAAFLPTPVAFAQDQPRPRAPELAPVILRPLPTQTINLGLGVSATIEIARRFSTIQIADPTVLDVVAETDRSATLVPKAAGITSLNILDENGAPISRLLVEVNEIGPSRIIIHNKALLTSHTAYRCSDSRCEYVNEVTATEPYPLPRGHENTKSDSTNRDLTPRQ